MLDTRFYFDNTTRIYDPRTGTVIKDIIKFLKFNDSPSGVGSLGIDLSMEVTDSVLYPDGYKDDSIVKVTFSDTNNDGIPDDPTVFTLVVGEFATSLIPSETGGINITPNPEDIDKLVFLEKYLDYDNIERFRWRDPLTISISYFDRADIELYGKYSNPIGTVFYAVNEQKFYVLVLQEDVRTIVESTDYIVRIGRSSLRFQYKHNSPNDRRIDPSPTNIIDMFVLTSSYDTEYRRYIKDITGSVSEPSPMTTIDMALLFQDLENFKL